MKVIDIIKRIVKIAPIVLGVWETIQTIWNEYQENKSNDTPKDSEDIKQIEG